MNDPYKYLVCIQCLTYNHEKYLADALEGFVMQKTNFPFVAIVHDDASTDGTADILRKYAEKYPDIIHPMYETENQYSKHDDSLGRIMDEAIAATGAKYIAICEGDDYWTDPYKLQKQVDILETDESLIGVFTNRCLVDFEGNLLEERRNDPKYIEGRVTMRDFFAKNLQYPTASVLFRNSHMQERIQKVEHMKNPYLGDWTLWIALHCFGDFYYLDEVSSAYRINPTSVTHTQWVKDRVGRAKLEFDLLPRVADVLPEEYADIAADLRNTNWAWLPLAKAYYKDKQYVRMIWALIVYAVKNPRAIGSLMKKVWNKLLRKNK